MQHKIGIVGAGYVGTACEICFSAMPNASVTTHDKYKPSCSLDSVVADSDILFVCVPTPMQEDDGACDTRIVEEAVYSIVSRKALSRKTIVIKSTVPPGTTMALQQKYPRHSFVFNPEFLTEANFISDFANQEFIVLGETDVKANNLYQFYVDFAAYQESVKLPHPVIKRCTSSTAELMKYSVNAFLSTKVTFFNELNEIAQASGIDFKQLRELILLDKRVGSSHTQVPGKDGYHGFGGKCLAKDLNGLIAYARTAGCDPILLDSAWSKNLLVRECYDWENISGAVTKAG